MLDGLTGRLRGAERPVHEGAPPSAAPLVARSARRVASAILPLAALALVAGLDAVSDAADPSSIAVLGLLDEPAHLATAWLVLTAFLPARALPLFGWALVGAVAIDVDHVPLYLWHVLAAGPGSRPVTHSLLTVVVLAAAAVASRRLRLPLSGLALGVVLHFVRDLAEGPGVPLLWPLDSSNVTVPYAVYLLVLSGVTAVAVIRRARGRGGWIRTATRRVPSRRASASLRRADGRPSPTG
jgi:inner membrane protein